MTVVYLVWRGDYEEAHVAAVYERREDAEQHVLMAPDASIEEHPLRQAAATWRPYFHATGQVGETNDRADIEPTVERSGMTDSDVNDKRVHTCPGSGWMLGADPALRAAVWLSAFGMDEDETLRRCQAKYEELRERRTRDSRIPSSYDLIREAHNA